MELSKVDYHKRNPGHRGDNVFFGITAIIIDKVRFERKFKTYSIFRHMQRL